MKFEYKKGIIRDFEKKMLIEMDPQVFLPMSFVDKPETDEVSYDLSGFVSLNMLEGMMLPSEAYTYLDRILKSLVVASEYLIDPASIALSKETVYIRRAGGLGSLGEPYTGEVRLMYLPTAKHGLTINQNLEGLIEELMLGYISHSLRQYLETTLLLLQQNCGLCELMAHISKVRREIHLGGVQ